MFCFVLSGPFLWTPKHIYNCNSTSLIECLMVLSNGTLTYWALSQMCFFPITAPLYHHLTLASSSPSLFNTWLLHTQAKTHRKLFLTLLFPSPQVLMSKFFFYSSLTYVLPPKVISNITILVQMIPGCNVQVRVHCLIKSKNEFMDRVNRKWKQSLLRERQTSSSREETQVGCHQSTLSRDIYILLASDWHFCGSSLHRVEEALCI